MELVILSGASGSGKTAIAAAIEAAFCGLVEVIHFDRVGVPSSDAVVTGWSSAEKWQRAMTIEWISRVAGKSARRLPVLFEGQMRLSFLREALKIAGLANAQVILVDCDDEDRKRRLTLDRKQPELANPDMMKWARFLRLEALEAGCEILDTTRKPLAACVSLVGNRLGLQSEASGPLVSDGRPRYSHALKFPGRANQ